MTFSAGSRQSGSFHPDETPAAVCASILNRHSRRSSVPRLALATLCVLSASTIRAADDQPPTAAEEKAIQLIRSLKGEAKVDPALDTKARVSAVFDSATDAVLIRLYKEEAIGAIEIRNTSKLSDRGFSTFAAMNRLQKLILSGGGMSYTEATRLGKCRELTTLYVGGMKMTDKTTAGLRGLTQLKALDLLDSPVSDRAVDTILVFQGLEELNLSGTRVTDAGVKKLLSLPKLKTLQLNNSKVTRAGVDALTDALKNENRDLVVRW